MATPASLAQQLYEARLRISNRATQQTQQLWRSQMRMADLSASWDYVGPRMGKIVTDAQTASATLSTPYVVATLDLQGYSGPDVVAPPQAYAGIAPDGRELVPSMYAAVTGTKKAIGVGYELGRAFEIGAAVLAAAVKTAVQEMGQKADQVVINGKLIETYVRAISPGACSRCAMLAGTWSSAKAFPRHHNCKCVAVPVGVRNGKPKKDLGFKYDDPMSYFESLSVLEQNRTFTNAGAQAIRDGADINQVVNARRGASGIEFGSRFNVPNPNSGRRLTPVTIGTRPDGSPLQVFKTGEGTTRRGYFGRGEVENSATRRSTTLRLMPEQIYQMSGGDTERAAELLKRYGYIL
jgi:hypothetical protein